MAEWRLWTSLKSQVYPGGSEDLIRFPGPHGDQEGPLTPSSSDLFWDLFENLMKVIFWLPRKKYTCISI